MFDSSIPPGSRPLADPAPALRGPQTAATATARISSGRLFAGARELVIEHAGQAYHLRVTRNHKLILTK